MLIEAAWSYRFPARISREQLLRQEALAKPIRDTAWKAQQRLCRRYRKRTVGLRLGDRQAGAGLVPAARPPLWINRPPTPDSLPVAPAGDLPTAPTAHGEARSGRPAAA
jgi:hypothetical protein